MPTADTDFPDRGTSGKSVVRIVEREAPVSTRKGRERSFTVRTHSPVGDRGNKGAKTL